jgi:hypothetical protein
LVCFADRGGMQAEPVQPGQHGNIRYFLLRRHAVQRQRLASCVWANGDQVLDGGGLSLVQARARLKVKARVRDQHSPPFEQAHNALAEGIEQGGQFTIGGPAGAMERSTANSE